MAELGFIVGFAIFFALSFRGVRTAIWLLLAYAWFRSDPLDALLWFAAMSTAMLAWKLLKAASGEARAERLGR